MSQTLRIRHARARVDLGQQAPIDADAARQHRRRVVDHHRGRADHRCQRGGDRTRSCRTSAPTRSPIQRMGITQNEDDFERMRNNPLVTLEDADAVKRFATSVDVDHGAGADADAAWPIATRSSRPLQVQGVSEEYLDFATFDAERGRMITPTEIKRKRPVTLIGWGTADRLFGRRRSARQEDQDRRRAVHGGRRQQEEGRGVRPVARRVRGDSARRLSEAVRRATVAGADGQAARRRRWRRYAQDEARVALRVDRGLKPAEPDNFGIVASDSVLEHLPAGDGGHRRGAGRHRRPVAAGRRHRDHEHHADGGQRADARDRPAQGARRQAPRHHVAGADRIDHAVGGRRHHRHRARRAVLDHHFVADAGAVVGGAVVGGARRDRSPRRSDCSSAGCRRGARPCSIRSKRCGANSHVRVHETVRAAAARPPPWRSTRCAATRCARR